MRLTRIDNVDLNLFEFDYDLTFMVFFLNANGKIYARYGGRDAHDPDSRQSLKGLRYTMQSVLDMHGREEKMFAARSDEAPKFIREVTGKAGRCMHCHQIKEALHANLKRTGRWTQDVIWRYPLPENLGMTLEVDRGNVVKTVVAESPAAVAGLKPGDLLTRLGKVPIHSLGDAQLALDRAPKTGTIAVAWQRGQQAEEQEVALPEGWRKSDLTWRPSMQNFIPSVRLYGTDLTADERRGLGLSPKQLAFRQRDAVPKQARDAGVRGGDVILGLDGRTLELDVDEFLRHVQRQYLVGDQVTVNLLRDGKRLELPMTLAR